MNQTLTGLGDRKTERVLFPLLMDLPVEPDLIDDDVTKSSGTYKAYVTSGAGGVNTSNNNNNNNSDCSCACGAECSCSNSTVLPTSYIKSDSCSHPSQLFFPNISDPDELEFYRDFFDDDDSVEFCAVNTQPYSFVLDPDTSHAYKLTNVSQTCENSNNNAATRGGDAEETPSVGQESGMVTLMVYGSEGVAGPLELNNGERDMFAAGKQDEFDVSLLFLLQSC